MAISSAVVPTKPGPASSRLRKPRSRPRPLDGVGVSSKDDRESMSCGVVPAEPCTFWSIGERPSVPPCSPCCLWGVGLAGRAHAPKEARNIDACAQRRRTVRARSSLITCSGPHGPLSGHSLFPWNLSCCKGAVPLSPDLCVSSRPHWFTAYSANVRVSLLIPFFPASTLLSKTPIVASGHWQQLGVELMRMSLGGGGTGT